jgi:hypothetical protein
MRNRLYIFIVFIIFASCNLKEALDNVDKINSDLKPVFKHEKITTSIKTGTDAEDNNVQVTFYEYKFGAKTNKSLDSLALKIRNRIIEKNPQMKELDHIEIRFTEEKESENNSSFVSFKYK